MTEAVLTSFIFNLPKLSKLWRKLEADTKREIAKRANEIEREADFLRILAEVKKEVKTGQARLF